MKKICLIALVPVLVPASGCSLFHRHQAAAAKPAPATAQAIVTPDFSLAAKVVSVNVEGRFVVMNFPPGQMPKLGQTLFLYRDGLKVAQLKVTGPQEDDNIVADLVTGDAQTGDTVRDE